jgi:hypothetical protein
MSCCFGGFLDTRASYCKPHNAWHGQNNAVCLEDSLKSAYGRQDLPLGLVPLACRKMARLKASKNALHAAQRPPGRAPALDICLPPWRTVGWPADVLKDAYGGFWGTTNALPSCSKSQSHAPAFANCCKRSVALIQDRLEVCCEYAPVLDSETFGYGAVCIDGRGACHDGAAICCQAGEASAPTIVGFVTSASRHGSGARRPCGLGMLDWKHVQPGQTVVVINPYASSSYRQATLLAVP